jgi:TonB family protein
MLVKSLMLVLLFGGGLFASAQKNLPCGDNPDLLRDKQGKPVRFTAGQLKGQATQKVKPKVPTSCRCQGTVVVFVQVNTDGEVVCAKVESGHPLLRASAVVAARQWKFKPTMKDDKPVAIVGWLAFQFSSEGKITY